jgi:hypothetical protein
MIKDKDRKRGEFIHSSGFVSRIQGKRYLR